MEKRGVFSRLRTAVAVLRRELRAWLFSGFVTLFFFLILDLIGILRLQGLFETLAENDFDFDEEILPVLIMFGVVLVIIRLGIAAIPGLVQWTEDVLDSSGTAGSKLESVKPQESIDDPPSISKIVVQMRIRARRLRRIANLLLSMVFVLLACGFFAFQGANIAAARWNSFMTGPLQGEVSMRRNEIQSLFSQLANGDQQNPVKATKLPLGACRSRLTPLRGQSKARRISRGESPRA